MIRELSVDEFLQQSAANLTLDVRSEGEYNHAHIPHSSNLPLFNNEERSVAGTLYKQHGRNDAIQKGLEIIGPKMAGFTQLVIEQIQNNKVFVHCWRGGMRSSSMAWLLNLMGWDVYVLKGGYKAYRNKVLEHFTLPKKYALLGGFTGSGKTKVLNALHESGEQVIDLEALANHKGSAFGALGEREQPSTEMFENLLHQVLMTMNHNSTIWVEDESKTIGKVYLNNIFLKNIRQAAFFVIEIPFAERVEALVNSYGSFSFEELEAAIHKISKRLGNENSRDAITALTQGDITSAAAITLRYYDKAYQFSLEKRKENTHQRLHFDMFDAHHIAKQLIAQNLLQKV